MKLFLKFVLARIFPGAWVLAVFLGVMSLAFFFLHLGEGMTGRKGADDFALYWSIAFLVSAPILYVHQDHFSDPE